MNVIAVRDRVRALDRPPDRQQIQGAVLIGAALVVSAPFLLQVPSAGNPLAALGIALQTLGGLLAAAQLWANGLADAAVAWTARQIGKGRRRIVGLLDGRLLSMLLAAGCYLVANLTAEALWTLAPSGLASWIVAVPALVILAFGAVVYVLAMFMLAGSVLAPRTPLPDGEAVTGAQARLAVATWMWPAVGAAILVGGLLQVAAV